MKICVSVLLALAAVAIALPVETLFNCSFADDNTQDLSKLLFENYVHLCARRTTSDLLSAFKVNDFACAAHCMLRGKSGGSCNSRRVCVCRKSVAVQRHDRERAENEKGNTEITVDLQYKYTGRFFLQTRSRKFTDAVSFVDISSHIDPLEAKIALSRRAIWTDMIS
ncbi:PREDICTED: defensin-like [Dinoponera quadriceps]|uniref:Defensin-like n=1 Tax=Dinoponera quadriceps TaxID=609295 RepID=A0A6P3Y1J1_DINQU|nr:PREDICTED: defensin-like [Dinoponera quadriceps]